MATFAVPPIDARAAYTRAQMRRAGDPRDIASGTLRLALHLSDLEYENLRELNPDTLGHPDDVLAKLYWRAFAESPEAAPFRIHGKL